MRPTRRVVLRAGAAGAASALTALGPAPAYTTSGAVRLRADPFRLGVASGDPWVDGFVLWTRLAMRPLAGDGRGGMPSGPVDVRWRVAEDPQMTKVVRRGTATARPRHAHSVHVTLRGLDPGREYWYQFAAGRFHSRRGRTMTAPARQSLPSSLAMSFASCSQYEHGFFTAYRRMAQDEPDLVLHLGDYQYEYKADTYVARGGNVRDHAGPETTDLATYRQRHAQYKTDADLQAAHAVAPWLVVWDDHEVANNWADEVSEKPADQAGFLARRAAAFRAYYENMPLRRSSAPAGIDLKLYRRFAWGQLATFHMLDTRQYRADQACGGGFQAGCAEADDPRRSITGNKQEQWLIDGFRRSTARWDLLGQQVFFAQRDSDAGAGERVSMDAWDGYAASRERITRGWVRAGVRNPVVLTGDVHTHWASDLKIDYNDDSARTVGAELVCSSITSGGDGRDYATRTHPWLANNPHLRFQNNLRGYVRTTITREEMTADFRCLPYVSRPGAPAFTRASFTIHDREPGLELTRDNPPASTPHLRSPRDLGEETIRQETQRP